MKVKGRTDVRVIAQGGDGGTTDIGFGCLSGMFERNDDVLYICYDNEAYMNTGVQRSSGDAAGGAHRHDLAVGAHPATRSAKARSVPQIAMAHNIPYVATASVADLRDLEYKVTKAMSLHGARYIHIFVPCPLGWGAASEDTIKLARLVVESGLFPLFEAEHGEVTGVYKIRKPRSGGGIPETAEALRAFVRQDARRGNDCAAPGGRGSKHPPIRSARRTGAEDEQTLCDYVGRRLLARQSHRVLAHLAACVCGSAPALQSPMPRRREYSGLAVSRRVGRLRERLEPLGAAQPVSRDHGPRLLSQLRERLQSRPAR